MNQAEIIIYCYAKLYFHLTHAGFLLGLFFDPDDDGEIFMQNAGRLSMDYTA
jgi:hypothetical protein